MLLCTFGGGLLGMWLSARLPAAHQAPESRDVVRLGMGLIATVAALVLGLVIADAKSSYDAQRDDLTRLSANLILLDRILAHYGPETQEARSALRRDALEAIGRIWPAQRPGSEPAEPSPDTEEFFERILKLSPRTDEQRSIKTLAVNVTVDIGRARFLLTEQRHSSVPAAFLIVLVFWLTIIFVSFGLFAPRNTTILLTLFVCAVSVSGAIYLILQLHRPWEGLIQLPSAPLRNAVMLLGR